MQIFTRKALILENISRTAEAYALYKKIDQYYSSDPHDIFLGDHVTSQFKIAEQHLLNGDIKSSKKYIDMAKKGSLEAYGFYLDMHLPIIIQHLKVDQNVDRIESLISQELDQRKKRDIYSYADGLKVFSESYYLDANPHKCINLMEESINIKSKILSKENINLIESKYVLAECYKKIEENGKAGKLFLEIFDAFIDSRHLDIYDLNNLFISTFYNHLLNITKINYDKSKVFELVKLIDSTNNHSSVKDLFIREYIDDAYLKDALFEKESLKRQKIGIETELFKLRTSSQINRKLEKDYLNQLKNISKNLQNINTKIIKDFPELSFLTNKANISLKDIRNLISNEEKIIVYTSYKNNLVILLLSQLHFEIKIIENDYDQLLKKIKKLNSLLKDPYSENKSFTVAKEIYDLILRPIEDKLKISDKIIIINDEELSSFPFSSLIDKKITGKKFSDESWLLKKYNFSYLPSIDSYYLLKKLKKKNYDIQFTGIGDPDFNGFFDQLPNTKTEVIEASKNFEEKKIEMFLGSMANEEIIKQNVINSKFTMFATHAITPNEIEGINDSAIVLSLDPSSSEDGFLTSTEIINTKFISDLLILSACKTAQPDSSGKYFSGLTRSFLYSGSRNLLATLWSIETLSAEELTTNFFSKSKNNYSKGLKNAQITLLNSYMYDHPFYWSPYIIIGVN